MLELALTTMQMKQPESFVSHSVGMHINFCIQGMLGVKALYCVQYIRAHTYVWLY